VSVLSLLYNFLVVGGHMFAVLYSGVLHTLFASRVVAVVTFISMKWVLKGHSEDTQRTTQKIPNEPVPSVVDSIME
jgi:hypothetical protein